MREVLGEMLYSQISIIAENAIFNENKEELDKNMRSCPSLTSSEIKIFQKLAGVY